MQEAVTKSHLAVGLSPEERNLSPLLACMGSTSLPPKLPKVGSAFLPPAEAEDMESQLWTQHNQPNQPQLLFLIQTALLRANLRKSYNQTALLRTNLRKSSETTFGLFTTPSWQIPWDDDTAASITCRPTPA